MSKRFLVLLIILSLSILLEASTVKIALSNSRPHIDGKLDDKCWQHLKWYSDFSIPGSGERAKIQTKFKVMHDNDFLYLGIIAEEPDIKKIKRDASLPYLNDSIEIFLGSAADNHGFFQLAIDNNGNIFDAFAEADNLGHGKFHINQSWNYMGQFAVYKGKNFWSVEIAIPFSVLDKTFSASGAGKINIGRSRYANGRELSSFSQISPQTSFHTPEAFTKVKLNNFKPSSLQWGLGVLNENVKSIGGKLFLELDLNIINNSERFALIEALAVLDKNGKESKIRKVIPAHKNKEYREKILLPLKKEGLNRLQICLKRRNNQNVLKVLQKSMRLKYEPLKIIFENPFYRDNLYATQKDQNIRAKIISEKNLGGKQLLITLTDEDKKVLKKQLFSNPGKSATVNFSAKDLPFGKYYLSAVVQNENKVEISVSAYFNKLRYHKGEVWLDTNGVTYVDGKAFIPYGWFRGPENLKFPYVNTIQTYVRGYGVKPMLDFLDKAHSNGLKVILIPFQGTKGWRDPLFFGKNARRGQFSREQAARTRYAVNKLKMHPAVLGWYLCDEPEERGEIAEWYRQAYAVIKEADPYHPCIILNCSISGIKKYYEGCDILMPDCYPVYNEGASHKSPEVTINFIAAAKNLRPTWFAPQNFSWTWRQYKGRPPTFDEIRFQTIAAYTVGAAGILNYCFHDNSQRFLVPRMAPEFLGLETENIKNGITGIPLPDHVAVTPRKSKLHFVLRKSGKHYYLFIVNADSKSVLGNIEFKNISNLDKLYVIGEARTVSLKNNKFADDFPPMAARIYSTDKSKTGKYNIKDFKQKIKEQRSKLKNPGNIVAMGELTDRQLKEFAESGNKPFSIKVSSFNRAYFNQGRDWQLYTLFDGITEHVTHFSWAPTKDDPDPHLLITFKEPREIGKVIVFTAIFDGVVKIKDCILYVKNGHEFKKVAEIRNNTNKKITMEFPNQRVRQLKLKIKKYQAPADRLCRGIINEIEIYKKQEE